MPTITGSTASTFKTVLGIAKEPQPATGTLVPPTDFIPVRKFDVKNTVTKLLDQSWRGAMVETTGVQNGTQSASIAIEGDAFPDTIGYYVVGMLGDLATVGSTAPFTHTVALLNSGNGQPVSYSITDSDSLSTRGYASTRWTDFSLTYDASKLLTYSATGLCWATQGTGSAPTQSYSTILPAPSWECAASYGGSATGVVQSAELSWKRSGAEAIFTLQNSQNPYEIHVGQITLVSKITIVAADETWLTDYLADTTKPLVLNMTPAGSAATQIQVTMTGHNLQNVNKSKGKSYIEFEVEGLAVGNTVDVGTSAGYSPCKVVLQNAKPSGTYA
jgi:hypothetical protein